MKQIKNYFKKLIVLSFFFCAFVEAQTNVKSGDIRACDVWNNAYSLNDATIINGTTITATTPPLQHPAILLLLMVQEH